jgi:hypothetical protein
MDVKVSSIVTYVNARVEAYESHDAEHEDIGELFLCNPALWARVMAQLMYWYDWQEYIKYEESLERKRNPRR